MRFLGDAGIWDAVFTELTTAKVSPFSSPLRSLTIYCLVVNGSSCTRRRAGRTIFLCRSVTVAGPGRPAVCRGPWRSRPGSATTSARSAADTIRKWAPPDCRPAALHTGHTARPAISSARRWSVVPDGRATPSTAGNGSEGFAGGGAGITVTASRGSVVSWRRSCGLHSLVTHADLTERNVLDSKASDTIIFVIIVGVPVTDWERHLCFSRSRSNNLKMCIEGPYYESTESLRI